MHAFAHTADATGGPRLLSGQQQVIDASIGHYLRQACRLNDEQVERVLEHQRARGLRFGEAAVSLGLATQEDVLWALSQQFHYPYAPEIEGRRDPELVAAVDPFSDEAEAFREIRSRLMVELDAPGEPPRALAVLSPAVGDGKTYFAANLAVAFSQLGSNTLLIDADLRTPRLHRLFGLGEGPGLSGILSGRCESGVIQPVAGLPHLHLLPAGAVPPNPQELVQRPGFRLLVREVLAKFDHVVVDTPAAAHGADARLLAAHCGAALVIGRRRTTQMKALQRLVQDLGKTGARMTGVLVNEY
jgi:protein-tyrosine kinase